jgi:hypothetical protein
MVTNMELILSLPLGGLSGLDDADYNDGLIPFDGFMLRGDGTL